MMDDFKFDLDEIDEGNNFDPMPAGVYPSFVKKAEWKKSKAGSEYLNVEFRVFGEKYNNRAFFNIMNLMHPKDQVRNIAMAELKRMLLASGFAKEGLKFDSKELLVEALLTCRCNVKLGQKTDEYGVKNVIKGYDKLDGEYKGAETPEDCPF